MLQMKRLVLHQQQSRRGALTEDAMTLQCSLLLEERSLQPVLCIDETAM
jgi:hypothetical protein